MGKLVVVPMQPLWAPATSKKTNSPAMQPKKTSIKQSQGFDFLYCFHWYYSLHQGMVAIDLSWPQIVL
jgi:hypothetical protein